MPFSPLRRVILKICTPTSLYIRNEFGREQMYVLHSPFPFLDNISNRETAQLRRVPRARFPFLQACRTCISHRPERS